MSKEAFAGGERDSSHSFGMTIGGERDPSRSFGMTRGGERDSSHSFGMTIGGWDDKMVRMGRTYYVYIMTNKSRTLYTGVRSDLERRVLEHKRKAVRGFMSRYNIGMLVHWEEFGDVYEAIQREKEIKAWRRGKKVALLEGVNPGWRDLAEGWGEV